MTSLNSVTDASTDATQAFAARVTNRTLRVGVMGLGYTGLPLACGFSAAGFAVVGVDIDAKKVESVNRGESYLPDLSDIELGELIGQFSATTDPRCLEDADAIILSVPTPTLAGEADLSLSSEALLVRRRQVQSTPSGTDHFAAGREASPIVDYRHRTLVAGRRSDISPGPASREPRPRSRG